MRHLISDYREEDVVNEVQIEDLLHRDGQGIDVGSLAGRHQIEQLKLIHSTSVWLLQTQTWMYNQVKQLQHLGVEAHVACERTENPDQFAVANIHSLNNEPLFRQVREKGLRKLRIRRQLNYLVYIGRKTGANIIHSHFGNVGWDNLRVVLKLKVKHVVTFYGYDVNRLPVQQPVWRERYRELFYEVDLVLCEGSHMARCAVELGCPDHKVKVQHLGVDVDNVLFCIGCQRVMG